MNHQVRRPRRHRAPLSWLVAACAIGLSGCKVSFAPDCVTIGLSGILVTVVEATGGHAISATPTVRLIDGEYEETATRAGNTLPHLLTGAIERTGTYSVIVEAEGYATARRDDVVVSRGGPCNYLRSVELRIGLSRS